MGASSAVDMAAHAPIEVALSASVHWRGEDFAPAWAIAEAHHLDPFLSDEEV